MPKLEPVFKNGFAAHNGLPAGISGRISYEYPFNKINGYIPLPKNA
jgi:hypothetical protein